MFDKTFSVSPLSNLLENGHLEVAHANGTKQTLGLNSEAILETVQLMIAGVR
jgi:hypothetical protein